jgi:hypothetical protein
MISSKVHIRSKNEDDMGKESEPLELAQLKAVSQTKVKPFTDYSNTASKKRKFESTDCLISFESSDCPDGGEDNSALMAEIFQMQDLCRLKENKLSEIKDDNITLELVNGKLLEEVEDA